MVCLSKVATANPWTNNVAALIDATHAAPTPLLFQSELSPLWSFGEPSLLGQHDSFSQSQSTEASVPTTVHQASDLSGLLSSPGSISSVAWTTAAKATPSVGLDSDPSPPDWPEPQQGGTAQMPPPNSSLWSDQGGNSFRTDVAMLPGVLNHDWLRFSTQPLWMGGDAAEKGCSNHPIFNQDDDGPGVDAGTPRGPAQKSEPVTEGPSAGNTEASPNILEQVRRSSEDLSIRLFVRNVNCSHRCPISMSTINKIVTVR